MSWHADNWWWVAAGLLLLAVGGVALRHRASLGLVLIAAALVGLGLGRIHFVRTKALLVTDSGGAGRQPWRDEAWLTALEGTWLPPGTDVEHRDWSAPQPGSVPKDAWLITDGMRKVHDVAAYTLVPPDGIDAAVRDVQVKPAGTDVELFADVGWYGGKGEVDVSINRGETEVAHQRIRFESNGNRWISVREPAPQDPREYVVKVRAERDAWPQNDEGRAWYVPQTPGRVLEWKPGERDLVAAGWQAVVVRNPISSEDCKTVEDFVRNSGGGLVIVGKVPAGLEALSPVSMRQEQGGGRTVVFVLDASASMNESTPTGERKFSVLARAVESACAQLTAGDRVVVVTFNGSARKVMDGTRADIARALDGVSAEGGTVPDAALPMVADALKGDARERWVVLVTDGEVAPRALTPVRWRDAVGAAEVLVVAPSDAGVVGELVHGVAHGAYLQADTAEAWEGVLREQLQRRVEGRWQDRDLAWEGTGELTGMRGVAHGWQEGWRTPEAQVWALGAQGEVLVAEAQRGLGRAVWVGVEDSSLHHRVSERVLAEAGDRRFKVHVERIEGAWRVRVEGTERGRFLDGERLMLRAGKEVSMIQVGPGTYEGEVAVRGALRGTVVRRSGTGEALVARVVTSAVATGSWPATVGRLYRPEGGVELPVENPTGALWEPPGSERLEYAWLCWGAAAAVGLIALWRR